MAAGCCTGKGRPASNGWSPAKELLAHKTISDRSFRLPQILVGLNITPASPQSLSISDAELSSPSLGRTFKY